MEKISYLSIVLVFISMFFISENFSLQLSKLFNCKYEKSILTDKNFKTSFFIYCPNPKNFYLATLILPFSFLLIFAFLKDYRIFACILIFLIVNILIKSSFF
ncbi:MAG: hypothetical protein QXJ14_04675 [Candidatus Aenigmatarchaeota archaeon]